MICVDLSLGTGVCHGSVDIMTRSSHRFPVGYRLTMSPRERPATVVMTTLDKRMACYSIGWTNIMAVYELEEIVKWKANSCSQL